MERLAAHVKHKGVSIPFQEFRHSTMKTVMNPCEVSKHFGGIGKWSVKLDAKSVRILIEDSLSFFVMLWGMNWPGVKA